MNKYNYKTHLLTFLLFLIGGLLLSFKSYADIREGQQAISEAPTTLTQCVPSQTANEWLATLPTGDSQSDATQRFSDFSLVSQSVIMSQPEYNFCKMRYVATRNRYLSNGQGSWYQPSNGGVQTNSTDVNGTYEQVPSCNNLPADQGKPYTEKHTLMYTDSNDTTMCFSPKDLAEIDTCEQSDSDGNFETYISDVGGASCMPKGDGSVCPVSPSSVSEITTSGGETVYFYKTDLGADNSSCYLSSEGQENTTINDQMPTQGCATIGGLDYCTESSSNVCDGNGNCQAGCGSVTTGGQTTFVCAASDLDGDGVPDYADPDIDGDGIPNSQDLDNDNDGVDDPVYQGGGSTSSPFTTSSVNQILNSLSGIKTNTQNTNNGVNSLTGAVESLTGAIEGMTTGGGSGGGFAAGAQQITDGIEDLKEEISEGEFTAIGSRENGWSSLFGEEFLEELQEKKEKLTEKFNEEYAKIKNESASLITITASGGSFQERAMQLKGQSVDISFSRFNEMFSIIGLIVVFMCTVYAMFIVIGGNK